MKAGDIVRYWPGVRRGNGLIGTIITGDVVKMGGTNVVRINTDKGGTDHLALSHIEVIGRVDGDRAYVQTCADAFAVLDVPAVEDVVIENNTERIKMGRLMKGLI